MDDVEDFPTIPINHHPNVISGLLTKRAKLAGLAEALQDRLRKALIDLDHIDCTILLFDPEADLAEVKPKPLPPRHHAFKGQMTRAILDMLRTAKEDVDSKQITLRLMSERELNSADKRLLKTIQKRVGAALRELRNRDVIASRSGSQGLLVWSIKRPG